MQARSRMLGPFSPSFDIHNLLRNGLQKVVLLISTFMYLMVIFC
jgi:hypothetical protein